MKKKPSLLDVHVEIQQSMTGGGLAQGETLPANVLKKRARGYADRMRDATLGSATVRTFERRIRVDGLELRAYVVVTREKVQA